MENLGRGSAPTCLPSREGCRGPLRWRPLAPFQASRAVENHWTHFCTQAQHISSLCQVDIDLAQPEQFTNASRCGESRRYSAIKTPARICHPDPWHLPSHLLQDHLIGKDVGLESTATSCYSSTSLRCFGQGFISDD